MMANKPVLKYDALVVHCMDYRLQQFLHPWIMRRFGADNFDLLSLAGGVHDYELVLKYVQLAARIHAIKQIMLGNPEDCRAEGRAGPYERHKYDIQNALICDHPQQFFQPRMIRIEPPKFLRQ